MKRFWIPIFTLLVVGCFHSNSSKSTPNPESEPADVQTPNTDRSATQHSTSKSTARGSHERIALPSSNQPDAPLNSEIERFNPQSDQGWESEVFHDRVKNRFKLLTKTLKADNWKTHFPKEFNPRIRHTPIEKQNVKPLLDENGVTVVRHRFPNNEFASSSLRQFLALLVGSDARKIQAEFKVVSIEFGKASFQTKVRCQFAYERHNDRVQQNLQWNCRWQWDGQTNHPLLKAIAITHFDEATTQKQLFTDVTRQVLSNDPTLIEQWTHSIDQWRSVIDWRFGIEIIAPHGLAVGDVNGDGRDDLYVCEPGGLPNRLLIQQPDGTVQDASNAWKVDYIEPTNSALLIDLDNDGDQDLVLGSSSYVLFLENTGSQFERRKIHQSNSVARSLCAADYDQDGDLDIYVCGYFARHQLGNGMAIGRPLPYHDANNGVPNLLLNNQGYFRFTDVTGIVGLDENNQRFSYAATWFDFDDDLDLDLYVANDFGRNNLYRNDDGRFADIAGQAGVEDISAGMSVSHADFDRDGKLDLYVGNMFSSAGNRIAFQRNFNPNLQEADRASFQRHARGNTLFRNLGNGSFQDVSLSANANMGRWSWSSNFVDLNNDGWQDLAIGNGMVTNTDNADDL